MLRARFLEDVVLVDNLEFIKYDKEKDLDYSLAVELYEKGQVDILNPHLNDDLAENLELYSDDWNSFVRYKNSIIKEVNLWL